jgi:hypothetical protein
VLGFIIYFLIFSIAEEEAGEAASSLSYNNNGDVVGGSVSGGVIIEMPPVPQGAAAASVNANGGSKEDIQFPRPEPIYLQVNPKTLNPKLYSLNPKPYIP